jgi:hypothetical protein
LREIILVLEAQVTALLAELTSRVANQPKPKGLGELTLATLDAEICDWKRFHKSQTDWQLHRLLSGRTQQCGQTARGEHRPPGQWASPDDLGRGGVAVFKMATQLESRAENEDQTGRGHGHEKENGRGAGAATGG